MKLAFPGPILITGANGGLGAELTELFLEKGFTNIACQYRSSKDHIVSVLERYDLDPERHCLFADLADEENVAQMRVKFEERFGPIWGLINLAGGSTNGLSWKLSKADFLKAIEDNLLSAFLCAKEFIPTMRKNGGGRIINTSSVVGFTGVAGASHYSAAKAGIAGLTKSLSLELAKKNITVNAIALGYFNTGLINILTPELQQYYKDLIPLHRFGTPAEIFGLLNYLLGPEGGYLNGQTLHLNGGLY